MMTAAVVEKAGLLTVRQVQEPVMGDYEALCDLLYGAICSGTDSHIVEGSFPWISPYPTILGHESIGRVVKVGSKVRNFRVGDIITRVGTPATPDGNYSVTWGGFAEKGIARAHWAMAADGLPESEWKSYRVNQLVPPSIDPRVAPMFTTWRETLSYLQWRGVRAGHSVLVIGSGGNGFSFAKHAANLGAAQVAMVGWSRWKEIAMSVAGVTAYLDYRDEKLGERLRELQPAGFDYIIGCVGQKDLPGRFLPCLKPDGHYALYGLDDFQQTGSKHVATRGAIKFHGPGDYDEAETHQAISDFVRCGKLTASPWYDIEKPWPLDDINAALGAIKKRLTIKALIKLQNS